MRPHLPLFFMFAGLAAAAASPAAELPPHPRLMATQADFARIRDSIKDPGPMRDVYGLVERTALAEYGQPAVERVLVGRRMLDTSRSALRRIINFSMLYRLTGEAKWSARAEKEMLALAAFSDWHTDHFLDTAEAAAAMAIGYDWTFDALSPGTRDALRRALVRHALVPGDTDSVWWRTRRPPNNWLQVCEAGLSLAALAVAEDEPGLAGRAVARARANIPAIFHAYEPSGSYVEGPMYWQYGTTFHLMLVDALRTATGSSDGLAANPAFLQSAAVVDILTAPSGNVFNFGDCSLRRSFSPAMYWFARETRRPGLVAGEPARLSALAGNPKGVPDRFLALALLWMSPAPSTPETAPVAAWSTQGETPLAVFRPGAGGDALYAAIKGGRARSSHGHMDAGGFIFEAGGERWAVDPGMPNYTEVEKHGVDLFGKDRWKVFILGADAHSVPRIGDGLPDDSAVATLTAFDAVGMTATIDLSALYAKQAKRLARTLSVRIPGGIRVVDELSGAAPGSRYRFSWMTRADVRTDAAGATLTQNGKKLRLDVTADAPFTVADEDCSAPPAPHDAPLPGLRRVSVTFTTTGAAHTITVDARLSGEAGR